MLNFLLSRLYRSLGDYDVLRGIFTGHIGTQPITQKALEAEARGDYSLALKLYNEVRSHQRRDVVRTDTLIPHSVRF